MRNRSPWTVVCGVLLLFLTLGCHASGSSRCMVGRVPSTKSSSLGSAAIDSITETLSPILPFTGGVDLRRELEQEHSTWYDTVSSVVLQVRDAFGMTHEQTQSSSLSSVLDMARAGGGHPVVKVHKKKRTSESSAAAATPRPTPISSSKPFVSTDKIAELNLSDLTQLFQYAMEQSQSGFDRSRFIQNARDRVKSAIVEMDAAVQTSRGATVTSSGSSGSASSATTDKSYSTGNVDALYFCAVLRIFAEWRLLRQVPEGYKGYEVGMRLGHKDIVQNLYKMETAVHHWLDSQEEQQQMQTDATAKDMETSPHITSPTLRDLLQHEIDLQVHSKLPRLKEKSAAMGLLWVRRQLHYQTALFGNILEVPSSKFPTSHAAVSDAYKQVYGQFHGWAVQKIFNYSFQAAPDVEVIYKFMNPWLLQQVQEKAKRHIVSETSSSVQYDDDCRNGSWSTLDDTNKNPFERFLHHIGGELDKFGKHVGGQFDKFGKHVGNEWDKLVDSVVRVFDQDTVKSRDARGILRGGGGGASMGSDVDAQVDQYVSQQMAQDAHERIQVYLTQVEPLLQDLADLFDDLNMDDPTKV